MSMINPELSEYEYIDEEIDAFERRNMGTTVTGVTPQTNGTTHVEVTLPGISELTLKQNPLPPSFADLKKIQRDKVKAAEEDNTRTTEEHIQKYLLAKGKRKKIKISQKKLRKALSLDSFKLHIGRPTRSVMFYRYTRVPVQKKNDKRWKGNKKECCVLIFKTGITSFQFSYAICNEKDRFVKDEARYLCQMKMQNAQILTVNNMNRENSHLENIRAAIDNYFINSNKDPSNPLLGLWTPSVTAPRIVKELGRLIKLELEDEKNLWQEKI